jgi:HIV Tat-specific factor 1
LNSSSIVIAIDPATNEYDPAGWKPINSVPILREACSMWYYEDASQVKGPISARELAHKFSQNEDNVDIHTRVWSSQLADIEKEWKPICELSNVLSVIDIFADDQATMVGLDKLIASVDEKKSSVNITETDDVGEILDDFFSSTGANEEDEIHGSDEEYESDGGTQYVKNSVGHWVDVKTVPAQKRKVEQQSISGASVHSKSMFDGNTKKKKKAKFTSKNAKCWIYVAGLPLDTNESEVANFFSRVGLLDLDPETQKPKIKLYRYKEGDMITDKYGKLIATQCGSLKGDCSICFARPESVDLAVQLLDESHFRANLDAKISIQRAKFEQHGEYKAKRVSEVKRKVVRLAKLQAVGWDEDGENGRITGGLKGLRIVVLKYVFNPSKNDIKDLYLHEIESNIRSECEQWGNVEKITMFAKNPDGIVIIKFTQPLAASQALNYFNGQKSSDMPGKHIEAIFWDGVTDYTIHDDAKEEAEAEKRHEEFGNWLDEQELPEEFQLQVEGA